MITVTIWSQMIIVSAIGIIGFILGYLTRGSDLSFHLEDAEEESSDNGRL